MSAILERPARERDLVKAFERPMSDQGYTTDFNRWYLSFNLPREPTSRSASFSQFGLTSREAELKERKERRDSAVFSLKLETPHDWKVGGI